MKCSEQPEYDPDAPPWPEARPTVDGFRTQSWFDLSAAFHLTPESLNGSRSLESMTVSAMPVHTVQYPSSKSLLFEAVGLCVGRDWKAEYWIDAAQTQRYATSAATVDGAVVRYARRNALEPAFDVGLEFTMHGVKGRDINHALVGRDAWDLYGRPETWHGGGGGP